MKWSPQQNEALSKAAAWVRIKWSPIFYLAGYAGTGKSTIANEVANLVNGKVAFAAFTGKAAKVMRDKGCRKAKTIHSTIYIADRDEETGKVTLLKRPQYELDWCSMFIIDECSMVNEELARDLLSYDKPILVLGDPAQLPPVSGGGFFTSGKPDYMLTEIHRQAAENPILRLATAVREGRFRGQRYESEQLTVVDREGLDPAVVPQADTILVGRNTTRQRFNARLRELKNFTGNRPREGETLICLKNDKECKISNGETFVVADVKKPRGGLIKMTLCDLSDSDRKPVDVKVRQQFFEDDIAASKLPYDDLKGTQQFTYGYAITGHKSQGSQWQNVVVFDESQIFREDADRWLYTAVTRASEKLTLVI
ncbi:ATP-dependent DNA helicase [Aquibium microcysteis]|uniref:ATP-dependent DNA helicase n=1 Tax=Aquibium microcysteis TaxID=675281 RepID=UPI00165CFFEA|nr:ATP-dependent RecD-like DNA helicase [Aquibium microcysteis]